MVAPFDEDLGIVETAQAIGNSSAEVEAASIFGIRGQRLWGHNSTVDAINAPPAGPCGLAGCAEWQHVFVRRNAAPIDPYTENSICAEVTVERRGDDSVQAYRLHISAGAVQALTLAHAV